MKKGRRPTRIVFAIAFVFMILTPKMVPGFLPGRPTHRNPEEKRHPDVQKIEEALAAIKENRDKVLAVSKAITSKSNRALTTAFPDVCSSPSSSQAGPVPIPDPNTARTSASGSKTVKLDADRATVLQKESHFKKTEGDEVGRTVRKLEAKVRNILRERTLTPEEKLLFRKEWSDAIDKAGQLVKDLNQDVAEAEKILKKVKKDLGIKMFSSAS